MYLEAETEPISDEDVILADNLQHRNQRALLNREGVDRKLTQMKQRCKEIHVAALVLNNIKDINAWYGEAAGNRAITSLEEWVRATYPLESEVTFARLIGPRMAIADSHAQAGIHLRNLGELISTKQLPPFEFKGVTIDLNVSLGVLRLKANVPIQRNLAV